MVKFKFRLEMYIVWIKYGSSDQCSSDEQLANREVSEESLLISMNPGKLQFTFS